MNISVNINNNLENTLENSNENVNPNIMADVKAMVSDDFDVKYTDEDVERLSGKKPSTFKACGLPSMIVEACAELGYTSPTQIQQESIPFALEGRDILAQSQTGSGKTAAFMLPIIAKLIENPKLSALILSPTRELAAQIMDATRKILNRKIRLSCALLIGGEPMFKQLRSLQNPPRIIIGTPGRVNDHISRGSLKLSNAAFLVLDETDRMLDLGFGVQLDAIAEHLPKGSERQTFMFSATLPGNILKLANRFLNNPQRITIGEGNQPALKIKQDQVHVSPGQKYPELLKELDSREGSVIIFVATKMGSERLADKLCEDSHQADCLHGDLKQSQRNRVTTAFRNKKYRILVATDVAARGLDIPHIEHVINYDLPHCPEDYVHRIGRTARANKEGSALCFISPEDKKKWRAIQQFIDPSVKQKGAYERPDSPPRRGGRNGGGRSFGGRDSKRGGSNPFEGFKRRSDDNGGYARRDDRGPKRSDDRAPRSFDDRGPKRFDDRAPKRFDDRAPKRFDDRAPKRFDDRAPRQQDDRFKSEGFKPRGDRPFRQDRNEGFKPRASGEFQSKTDFRSPREREAAPRFARDERRSSFSQDKPRGRSFSGRKPQGSNQYS